jgi:DNA-binding CsgD family transcriptional regulator
LLLDIRQCAATEGGTVSELAPASLSGFLRFLSASPAGNSVAEAIVHGPLASLDARATTIFAAQGSDLVLEGDYGYTPEFLERFHTFSISSPFAMCRAYRQGEVIERTSSDTDTDAWIGDYDRELISNSLTSPDGETLTSTSVPIMSKGRSIGVWNLVTPATVVLDRNAYLHLDAVSSAVGMWMALQGNDRQTAPVVRRERLSPHTRITDRQLEVLRLLGEGRTNLQISVRLGFSDSTVKKEVQQLMVYLNVHDREAAVARARELGLLDPA